MTCSCRCRNRPTIVKRNKLLNLLLTKFFILGQSTEEGCTNSVRVKYFYDGHTACGVSLHPEAAIKIKNICPVCHNPLTLGVLHRVEQLADRPKNYIPANAIPQKHLIQLQEIIADSKEVAATSKKVQGEYERMLIKGGTEFEILMDRSKEELLLITDEKIAEAILRVRQEKVNVIPGFDGQFGKISIFRDMEHFKNKSKSEQMKIFSE